MKLTKRKAIIVSSSILVLSALGGTMAVTQSRSTAGADTSPVVTELDNHEARLKNAENNIKVLQANTGSTDSPVNTPVPAVTAPTTAAGNTATTPSDSTATVGSAAVPVVTGYREIVIDPDTSDCEYTYSDGSTTIFHWKTLSYTGSGEKAHQMSGFCDDRALGQPKN